LWMYVAVRSGEVVVTFVGHSVRIYASLI
jgi:hypothetical protein